MGECPNLKVSMMSDIFCSETVVIYGYQNNDAIGTLMGQMHEPRINMFQQGFEVKEARVDAWMELLVDYAGSTIEPEEAATISQGCSPRASSVHLVHNSSELADGRLHSWSWLK